LQELKNAGLVLLKEEGTKSFYTLKPKGIAKAEKQFKKLFKKLD
jgi:DNA-binding transcriptional regulator PaaX